MPSCCGLGQKSMRCLCSLHHIVSDAWSAGILVHEVLTLYTALSEGRPVDLPELPIQYADFALWQRQWLQGDVLSKQLDYWKRQFSGELPSLQLPTDHPRPKMRSYHGSMLPFRCRSRWLKSSSDMCREQDATL